MCERPFWDCPWDANALSDEEIKRSFQLFLEEHHLGDLIDIATAEDTTAQYSVNVNFLDLLNAQFKLAHMFIAHADRLLALFSTAIREFINEKFVPESQVDGMPVFEKEFTHARVHNLMSCVPELTKTTLPRSQDVNRYVQVRGTVTRTGALKMLEYERTLECARCKHVFVVHADPTQMNVFPKTARCPSAKEPACRGRAFKTISAGRCRDYQEMKMQELIQTLAVGSLPRSMPIVLENDLVDTCKAGDDVTICGIVKHRWKPVYDDTRCDLEMFMEAHHLNVNNQQRLGISITEETKAMFRHFWEKHRDTPLLGRNEILKCICPQIFGMFHIKLAVALAMVGGVPREGTSGLKVRGESHLLLVGDPGVGKSQFLKFAAKVSPRSVLTTGVGTTSAGLTVTAVKDPDGGEWMLEAGALVLADGGVCCIDEFSSIRKHDKESIHEAMEQQTLHVAKAGLVCTLSTKTTVLAATNPKGQYDPTKSMEANTGLASPLLSRFDLIFVLQDRHEEEWDRKVSGFILGNLSGAPRAAEAASAAPTHPQQGVARLVEVEVGEEEEETRHSPTSPHASFASARTDGSGPFTLEQLRAYIVFVQDTRPRLSRQAEEVLQAYYVRQRNVDHQRRNASRTTVRLLESLIRLAQAHARLCFSEMVSLRDAVCAILITEATMVHPNLMVRSNDSVHSRFPVNPDGEYAEHERIVLMGLGLWEAEEDDDWGTYGPRRDPAAPLRNRRDDDDRRDGGRSPRSTPSAGRQESSSPSSPPGTRHHNDGLDSPRIRGFQESEQGVERQRRAASPLASNASISSSGRKRSSGGTNGLLSSASPRRANGTPRKRRALDRVVEGSDDEAEDEISVGSSGDGSKSHVSSWREEARIYSSTPSGSISNSHVIETVNKRNKRKTVVFLDN